MYAPQGKLYGVKSAVRITTVKDTLPGPSNSDLMSSVGNFPWERDSV